MSTKIISQKARVPTQSYNCKRDLHTRIPCFAEGCIASGMNGTSRVSWAKVICSPRAISFELVQTNGTWGDIFTLEDQTTVMTWIASPTTFSVEGLMVRFNLKKMYFMLLELVGDSYLLHLYMSAPHIWPVHCGCITNIQPCLWQK